jgi:hypothetical protein
VPDESDAFHPEQELAKTKMSSHSSMMHSNPANGWQSVPHLRVVSGVIDHRIWS